MSFREQPFLLSVSLGRIFFKFLLFAILFAHATSLFAYQSTSDSLMSDTVHSYTIDEYEVVGKKNIGQIIPPKRLSGLTLQSLNAQSVADAVRYFSGVQVKDYGGVGGLKTINIRSMGTNQMGVFYDGIQMGNAQNGQVDLGRFSLDNMESISIYNGQKSSLLQSAKDYGSAGTIYLNTRRPQFTDNKRHNLTARFKTGSFGLVNPSVLWQQKINDRMSYSFSTEYIYANGRYKFTRYDTTLIRHNSDIKALRTEATLFGNTPHGDWKFQIYNYNSERGLPGYIARNLFRHDDRQWDNNFFIQSSIRQQYNRYAFQVNAKYANDYLHYIQPDTVTLRINNRYRQQEFYISTAQGYRFNKTVELSLAVDYQYNFLGSDMREFVFPTRHSIYAALAGNIRLKKLKLQSSLLVNYITETLRYGEATPDRKAYSPSFIVSYEPFEQLPLALRSFVKRSFRMPTFNDLYYTSIISGAAKLKPEFVNQFDVGAEYIMKHSRSFLRNLNISIDVYYNEVTDKIVAVPTNSSFRWMMTNLGKVKIIGADLSFDAEFRLTKHLYLNALANYTYQNARDFTDPNSLIYKRYIPYTPLNSFTTALNINYHALRFNYCFIYTGERYNGSANRPIEDYVQPWYTHDLSVGYNFTLKKNRKLYINIDLNNVLNQQYDVVLNYPMPGTNFKISATWDM